MRSLLAGIWNGFINAIGWIAGKLLGPPLARGWLYFPYISESLSRHSFSFGWKLRRAVYAHLLPRIGKDVVINSGVVIEDQRTSFGDDVWISSGTYIDYAWIGDHVLVGPNAVLLSGGRHHNF